MDFRNLVTAYSEVQLSRQLIVSLLGGYKNINDKINQLIKGNELIALKRGLYMVGLRLNLPTPHSFLIANHMRGPSYISLESALAHWDMIPERVVEISSITLKTSKTYENPTGRYSYKQSRTPYYSYGIQNLFISEHQTVLIASPEKALCDKVIFTSHLYLRSIKQTLEFLVEDLRIDRENLSDLDHGLMEQWIEKAPKKSSLKMLIKTLRSL